jgi:hypothetical protein
MQRPRSNRAFSIGIGRPWSSYSSGERWYSARSSSSLSSALPSAKRIWHSDRPVRTRTGKLRGTISKNSGPV